MEKTFYLETFGCQMNVHDSEKVVGTLHLGGLLARSRREEDADLILYNTCSIRDKAEQKVFHRLNDYKKLQKQGQEVRRAGLRGPAGRRKDLRARAVCLAGCRARRRTATCPQMLVQIEAGAQRVTGLDDRQTDETFETEFTARSNPHRGYITIIEGCDKFCAYCVVPYTRGKERSRTSTSVLDEARRMADRGYTEIQLLGQNVNSYRDPHGKKSFAELLARGRRGAGHPARALHHLASARLYAATSSRPSTPCPRSATTCICRCRAARRACSSAMLREYTREQYLERIAWMKARAARDQHHHRHHRRLPGRDRGGIRRDSQPARRSRLRRQSSRSSTRPARTRRPCTYAD